MISFNLGMEVYILYDKVSYELQKGATSYKFNHKTNINRKLTKMTRHGLYNKFYVEFESAVCKYNAIPAHISAIPFGGDCIVCRWGAVCRMCLGYV